MQTKYRQQQLLSDPDSFQLQMNHHMLKKFRHQINQRVQNLYLYVKVQEESLIRW